MDVKLGKDMYGEFIELIPTNRKELLQLKNIWDNHNLKKVGYCVHAGGTTKHGIESSTFSIKVVPK